MNEGCQRCAIDWRFRLDDAAYEVSRGARAIAMPEALVSLRDWVAHLSETRTLEAEMRVAVRGEGVDDTAEPSVMPVVARDPVALELLDASAGLPDHLEHAVVGLLLGYDMRDIGDFVRRMRREAQPSPAGEAGLGCKAPLDAANTTEGAGA